MSDKTEIEWTDSTWNPVTGCTKVGPGCDNCYAETFSERWRGVEGHYFEAGFDLTLRPNMLSKLKEWKRGRVIFVCSMSDLFHKRIPIEYLDVVFDIMEAAPQHTYQVLTKRSSRMRDYVNMRYPFEVPPNMWFGVSVESAAYLKRIEHLRGIGGAHRFISFEPLLGPVGDVDLTGIHWAIVGGESGVYSRPIEADWAREIRDNCARNGVAFMFKQWGGRNKKKSGRLLDGLEYNAMPGRLI